MTTYSRIKEVKSKKRKELLKKPNVQGVGIGYKVKEGIVTKELSLRIYVEKKIAKESLKAFGFTEIIPDPEYKDVSYDIIEIGKIRFHGNLDKNRPTQGGDSAGSCHSISHGLIMTGTLGIPLVDKTDGTLVLLSNNHVFANKDHTNANLANVGDSIVQPGTLDGGSCHNDVIGTLKRWIEFDLNGDNEVDAAIAALNNESDAKRCTIGNDIGRVNGVRILTEEDDGLEVQKYGRTTGYTNGELIDTDVDVNVWYQIETDTGFDEVSITFVNQFLFTAMSQPGDSGSIILDMENKAVGLLFAGSNLTTIANPIAKVFELLELTLCPQIGIRCISVGPRPPLIPCKRVGPILHICKTIGGPIPIICPFGNPKFTIKPICLACGPDNDIGCGTGGSDFIIDVNKCKSGPFIDIRVIDPRIKDKDILVIDMSKIPKDMEKSIRNMLKKMNEEGEKELTFLLIFLVPEMYKNALNQALKLYPYLFDFISIRREKEGGFIFNPHIYSERWINNSSVEILELINGRNTVEDIINIITSKKQISYQQASNFVQSQLQILQSYFALKYLSNSLKEGEEQNPYHIPDNYVDYNANYYSAPLTVLWDITYRCNMKCVHCLIDNEIPRNELTLDQVKQVLDELRKLRVFSINFSGGEPFLRKDLLDILKHASSLNFNLKISTNGYYLTKDLLDKLGNLDVYCFQISLDGLGNTHDSFRNFKGGFKKAVEAFELVSQEGHFAVMSTMLTKYNYHEIFELLELAVSLGVSIFKLNSFMPTGRGKINQESLLLDKKDVMKLAKDMVEYSKKYQNKIDIQYDALFPWLLKKEEKQTDNQNQYHSCDIRCSAGHTTLVITSDGTVISCPYLTDYPLGNVLTTSISDIWHNNSSILGKFRKLKQIDLKGKCKSCLFVPESCPGGCRAAAKIRTGDFLQEDPFCWK